MGGGVVTLWVGVSASGILVRSRSEGDRVGSRAG